MLLAVVDDAVERLALDHEELEKVRIVMERRTGSFSGSRFVFVNVLITRFLNTRGLPPRTALRPFP